MKEEPPSPQPSPPGEGDPAPVPAPGAPPPAAQKVLVTPVKETDAAELVDLKRKLSEAEAHKRSVELRNAELEDENVRLRTPAPVPSPAKVKKGAPLTAYEAFAEEGPGDA